MNYKGAYDAGTEYAKGSVVMFTDGVPYYLQKAAPAGTTPHDVRYWNRVPQPFAEVVVMFHETFGKIDTISSSIGTVPTGQTVEGQISSLSEQIPKNIDDEGITLKDTEDNEYMITVDASGETPELAVTLIEEGD